MALFHIGFLQIIVAAAYSGALRSSSRGGPLSMEAVDRKVAALSLDKHVYAGLKAQSECGVRAKKTSTSQKQVPISTSARCADLCRQQGKGCSEICDEVRLMICDTQ